MRVDGPIVPVVANYLERGLNQAEAAGAVCIIELNTPGGLYDTTQEIVTRIINARVPVVAYVSPAGGWAGSAGTFIALAAHVTAMAPGSRIGAAHPVTMGSELPEAQMDKITEDAAAWVRSLAQMRGRDPDLAELAVKESRSFSDQEALAGNLIELQARDLEELMLRLDGRKVTLISGEELVLNPREGDVTRVPMNWVENLLLAVSDPNVAYILMTIGMLGIIVELYNPGAIFPGVAGGLSLILALYALGTLNAYWGGILLIILAFIFFIAEAFIISHGLLTLGGIASLVFGSLMLFSREGSFPQISLGLITGGAMGAAAFCTLVIGAVVRGQRRRVTTGKEGLVGEEGVALTRLDPSGAVLVEGERWQATAADGYLEAGTRVVVCNVQGLHLRVKRKEDH